MPLKTLLLNPPSFENFDGGAGSRWPATREIESYWYPVWLAYPAGQLEGSRLLDAPSHHVSAEETISISKQYEFLVLFTSTPGYPGDILFAAAIKRANPNIKIAFVGPHVSVLPERTLRECPSIDFVCRKEFDTSVVDYANGKPLKDILGVSFLQDGVVVHTPDAPQIENLDALPHVTDVYKRDLDVTRYNVPFLLHPYVALYSTRGCPAQCTFCLWPQTLMGHAWRKRSTDDVAAEMAQAKKYWPEVKEFFFDDDTFNIQKARTVELCAETIQVSVAHAYPGTELYDFAVKNGFMVGDHKMVDEGGHQMAQIQYPGLPADDLMEAVHHFYDEYYFRPKAAFRILYKAAWTSADRKRLYHEAKSFLKLRAQRNKWVRDKRAATTPSPETVSA